MTAARGPGLGTVVFLIFLVLKLAHVIIWSWWLVTAPLWITALAAVAGVALAVIVTLIEEFRHAH